MKCCKCVWVQYSAVLTRATGKYRQQTKFCGEFLCFFPSVYHWHHFIDDMKRIRMHLSSCLNMVQVNSTIKFAIECRTKCKKIEETDFFFFFFWMNRCHWFSHSISKISNVKSKLYINVVKKFYFYVAVKDDYYCWLKVCLSPQV